MIFCGCCSKDEETQLGSESKEEADLSKKPVVDTDQVENDKADESIVEIQEDPKEVVDEIPANLSMGGGSDEIIEAHMSQVSGGEVSASAKSGGSHQTQPKELTEDDMEGDGGHESAEESFEKKKSESEA